MSDGSTKKASTLLKILDNAAGAKHTVALPDALDVRTIEAYTSILQSTNGAVTPLLVVESLAVLHDFLDQQEIPRDKIDVDHVVSVSENDLLSDCAARIYNKRKHKGVHEEESLVMAHSPLYFAGYLLDIGLVDGVVAGSVSTTSDVLRAGITMVGTDTNVKTVSSFFLMDWYGRTLAFADCGVVPRPTAQQLRDIAVSTAHNFSLLTQKEPKVAMLSFATLGSAKDVSTAHVVEATNILQGENLPFGVDGELQFDAAFDIDVAKRKAPDSPVAGHANVFVFPDLNSGNIAYKIAQRMGGATAIGPIVQGLRKPYLDLSRGCNSFDIVMSAAIAALMSAQS